jgi:hypothetical protein
VLGSAGKADLEPLRAAFTGRGAGAPAGWDAIHAFEHAAGVVLPEPYRSFAALVGDGCLAGPPCYGLVPLRQAATRGWGGGDGLARLARPFPLTSAWIWEDGEPPHEPGITRDQAWDGTLLLGHDGCDMYWTLVVAGAHRGHIWNVTDVGAQPFGRSFGYTTATDGFAGWATHWAAGKDWYDAPH